MKKYLLICCMLVSVSAAAQVYKCKNATGKIEYQATPCHGTEEEKLRIYRGSVDASEADISDEARSRYESAAAQGKVSVGMTAKLVRRSWGEPSKINVTLGRYGRSEQWVYDAGYLRADYVYLENNRVTSIQSNR